MMSPKRKRTDRFGRHMAVLLGLGVLFLAGCSDNGRPLTTLDPKGDAATAIHQLVVPVFIVAGVVFVFINVGVLYVAVKYRRRRGEDDVFPEQVHGNTKLELGWTIVPALIMAGIAVGTVATLVTLANEPEDISQEFEVKVVGHQWWWSFEYDLDRDGTVDFETANEMVIPVGTPVHLKITSRDVIHSFWIPALNGKKDAAPGREHPLWMQADQAGRFLGQCTEFCGLSHAYMRMLVEAKEPADFEAWVEGQLAKPAIPAEGTAERRGLETFVGQCASCHLIEGVNSPDCTPITDEADYDSDANTCWVGASPYSGAAQVSGAAPNLTHMMSRYIFVGGLYELRDTASGELNRNNLEGWIRNPQDYKPMAPDPTRGNLYGRGMPKLPLTEDQLDDLVDYLATLGAPSA
jgi:cytochrome c oxidase subunit II